MEPVRRRRRPPLSCSECRRRKVKCDRNRPCCHCVLWARTCHYVDTTNPARSAASAPSDDQEVTSRSPSRLTAQRPTRAVVEAQDEGTRDTHQTAPDTGNDNRSQETVTHLQEAAEGITLRRGATSQRTPQAVASGSSQSPPYSLHGQSKSDPQLLLKKSRLFGKTHWSGAAHIFKPIAAFLNADARDLADMDATRRLKLDMQFIMQRYKDLNRSLKASWPGRTLHTPNVRLPEKGEMDRMVRLYISRFESVFRIVHIPSFWSEYELYWRDPTQAGDVLQLKVQLVAAIGSSICERPHGVVPYREEAQQWIHAAQSWISGPEKSKISISGLQVQCLLILARQVLYIGADLVWIGMGTTVRTAVQMGLHRDPKHFKNMTALHSEIRRRLWATILELNAQAALDAGVPPSLSTDDSDTEPPSNCDDEDIPDRVEEIVPQHNLTVTDASLQRCLLSCLRPRLEILRLLNSVQGTPKEDEVLILTATIISACRGSGQLSGSIDGEGFKRNFADMLLRRFILPLHRSSPSTSSEGIQMNSSRKVSLDAVMALISPRPDADFTRLLMLGGGMFEHRLIHASLAIASELMLEVQEHGDSRIMDEPCAYRKMLIEVAREARGQLAERMKLFDTNIVLHAKLSIVLSQAEGEDVNNGTSIQQAMAQGGKDSLELCYAALQARVPADLTMMSDEGLPITYESNADDGGLEVIDFEDIWQSGECMPDGAFGIGI